MLNCFYHSHPESQFVLSVLIHNYDIHAAMAGSSESLRKSPNLVDLSVEPADGPQRSIVRLGLGNLHVRSLQALGQNVHDLRGDIPNVAVPHVDLGQHLTQPVKTLLNVGVEARSKSSRDGERNKWRDLTQVVRVDSDEELVEDFGLAIRRDPLKDCQL